MRIAITKLTSARHRLCVLRDDGSAESSELETRSLLLHDLVHYAVEAEVPIPDGFWGLIANGTTFAEMAETNRPAPLSRGIVLAESIVGPMQSLWNHRMTVDRFLEIAPANDGFRPDPAFVDRAFTRLRALVGAYLATPFRGTLELSWPPGAPPRVHKPGEAPFQ